MKNGRQLMFVLTTLAVILAIVIFLPALISAGDLEPPDPPDSTMKTLDQIPPTWSQILHPSKRFEVLEVPCFTNLCPHTPPILGVLDKETGLVWEHSPSTPPLSWVQSRYQCYELEIGGRKGWRPPTIDELTSLIDTTQSNPTLPSGHPFLNVQSGYYWSSTIYLSTSSGSSALVARFDDGHVYLSPLSANDFYVWCVRGGSGHESY